MTLPVLPLSLPAMTTTLSSARSFAGISEHLRRQRHDLHEPAVAQLARHRAEDARAARVVLGVDDHRGVLVEGDVRAVVAPELLLRAHDDRLDDVALLDRPVRVGLLDGRDDDVPHARVAAARAAHDADGEDLARAGVVGHAQARLVLDHRARSRTSTSRQRFVRLSGRLSTSRTVSPMFASLRSSWACRVPELRMTFPYMRWRRAISMRTVIVLSALLETTTPWRTLRLPLGRSGCSAGASSAGGAAARRWPRFWRAGARYARWRPALRRRSSSRSAWRSSGDRGDRASPAWAARSRLRRSLGGSISAGSAASAGCASVSSVVSGSSVIRSRSARFAWTGRARARR